MYIQRGSRAFVRAASALAAGSFVTFAALYSVQPLLPEFSREYGVSPASASLSLSISTGVLSISMLLTAALSDAWGRKRMMLASLAASSLLVLLTAFAPNFATLLVLRALQGFTLAGLPAIAMAYVNEEFDPHALGLVMGLNIAGNSLGGMAGRLVSGTVADLFSWRIAMIGIGIFGILASIWFWLALPRPAHFRPNPSTLRNTLPSFGQHLRRPVLLALFLMGFLLMGGFVTLYNYITYVLLSPPYHLSRSAIGALYLVYLVGTFSSAWMGRLSDQTGRGPVLFAGILLTLVGAWMTWLPPVVFKLIGLAIFTFGFFGSHSVASSWVGAWAGHNRAQASSLYLLFYYVGSSLVGWIGGFFFNAWGWIGVLMLISVLLSTAIVVSVWLIRREKRLPSSH
ncbi:MFS transporter [Alicyclobacillus herbarius]|uniref:MFS transporter n=1 Tax=Alicyclobacillus herbarius TaxID=122960 RepID=UPI002352F3B3|nr:MFS transporter [Alicyclobacillus herbarius]